HLARKRYGLRAEYGAGSRSPVLCKRTGSPDDRRTIPYHTRWSGNDERSFTRACLDRLNGAGQLLCPDNLPQDDSVAASQINLPSFSAACRRSSRWVSPCSRDKRWVGAWNDSVAQKLRLASMTGT